MSAPIIYLDNATTTWPKPEPVYVAMDTAMREQGGNPGRGSHRLSIAAQKLVEDARQDVRRVFNAPSAERVVFTLNCTDALCLILKGTIKCGDRVITGPFEHTSAHKRIERAVTPVTRWRIPETVRPCRPIAIGHTAARRLSPRRMCGGSATCTSWH